MKKMKPAAFFLSPIFMIGQSALLTFAAATWWSFRNNTLFETGRWLVGKDTGKFVFYAYDFMFQPLRGGIELSNFMGFQELLYRWPEEPERQLLKLEAEVIVCKGGYLWVETARQGASVLGCRISRRSEYESGFYRFDKRGRLLEFSQFRKNINPDLETFHLKLERQHGRWRLSVNGEELGDVPCPEPGAGFFGFRGSGSSTAPVIVRRAAFTFHDPTRPSSRWTEVENFKSRRLLRKSLPSAAVFVFAILILRRLRRRFLAEALRIPDRMKFATLEDAGVFIMAAILCALPPVRSGVHLVIFVVIAELYAAFLGMYCSRLDNVAEPQPSRHAIACCSLPVASVFVLSALVNGGGPWRRQPEFEGRMANIHPAAFNVIPPAGTSSAPFSSDKPITVEPGSPFFVPGRAYQDQIISVDFVIPPDSTLDVVFQQRSYTTKGDPDGEELPLSRRMLRLSTRPDVAHGLARSTKTEPMPFLRVAGAVQTGATNHLEIASNKSGVRVVLNGTVTTHPWCKPLGVGEMGFLCHEQPVRIERLAVRPLGRSIGCGRQTALFTAVLPAFATGAFWCLCRLGGRLQLATAAGYAISALYPLAIYLGAGLMMGRNSLLFMAKDLRVWLDLFLLATALNHSILVLAIRRTLAHAALLFNLAIVAALVPTLMLVWDALPAGHPWRLRFTDEAVAPADMYDAPRRTRSGPWYDVPRRTGANTYVWKQRFGGKRIRLKKMPGTTRIFVVGGSQAWGSGAASSGETFSELLERQLRAHGHNVEIFNAGVNGAGAGKIAAYYEGLIRPFSPDIIIADMGLNDSAALCQVRDPAKRLKQRTAILADLRRMTELCRKDGVDIVLVLEPMAGEAPLRPDESLYRDMAELVSLNGGTVLNPASLFAEKEKTHMLWWDTAHMTPAGHNLFAEFLEPAVAALITNRTATRPAHSAAS